MKHYDRGFLNAGEGTALFETSIETSCGWQEDNTYRNLHAQLVLADCSRKIFLDFDVYSKDGLEERKVKVALLLKVVQEFHDKFLEAANLLTFEDENENS